MNNFFELKGKTIKSLTFETLCGSRTSFGNFVKNSLLSAVVWYIVFTMKTMYLAEMKWSESEEPVCAGTNKRKVKKEAFRILRSKYGKESISRGSALCFAPIAYDDIEISKIPII
jgi:hypothetical protein